MTALPALTRPSDRSGIAPRAEAARGPRTTPDGLPPTRICARRRGGDALDAAASGTGSRRRRRSRAGCDFRRFIAALVTVIGTAFVPLVTGAGAFATLIAVPICLFDAATAAAQTPDPEFEPNGGLAGEDAGDDGSDTPSDGRSEPMDFSQAGARGAEGRTEEFERTPYAFCHDEKYRPDRIEALSYCKMFDESSLSVCPNAALYCKAEEKKSDWWNLDLAVPAWVAWAALGLLVLLALLGIVRSFKDGGWNPDPEFDFGDAALEFDLESLQELPEAPSQVILRRARMAHDDGDHPGAAALMQMAALRYLDDGGLVQFHPSRTNGDYLRRIRAYPDLWALYRDVAFVTDRVRFGDGQTDPSAIATLLDRCADVLARAIGEPRQAKGSDPGGGASSTPSPVGTQLALCLVVLTLPLLQSCGGGNGEPFYDHSPTGMSALPALLRAADIDTTIESKPFAEIESRAGAVVIRTSAADRFGTFRRLRLDALLDRGVALVVIDDATAGDKVLPVTTTSTHGTRRRVVDVNLTGAVACGVDLEELNVALGKDKIRLPFGKVVFPEPVERTNQTSDYPYSMVPVLSWDAGDDAPPLAQSAVREGDEGPLPGCVLLFSDHQLFSNASLTREANARFVTSFFAGLIREGEQVVLLDTIDAEQPAENITRSLGNTHLLPFIVQALVWLIVLLVFLGAALGPLSDPVIEERHAFVDHVEALGRHYADMGVPGLNHAAKSLATLVARRHRPGGFGGRGGRRGGRGGWKSVAEHLSAQYDLAEEDVEAVLRLGIEGQNELGTPSLSDPEPSSERILRTLSILLSQQRKPTEPDADPDRGDA